MHVTIIGADNVGATCGYYVSKCGVNVSIPERANQAATGSAAKSAAGICHQF